MRSIPTMLDPLPWQRYGGSAPVALQQSRTLCSRIFIVLR